MSMNIYEKDIFVLIEKESYKQALNNVERLLKQFPSSSYYILLEQYVKFKRSPKKYSYEANLGPLIDNIMIVPNDGKSLDLLHMFLMQLGSPISPLKPYERAISKYPTFETCYKWFCKAIDDLEFEDMNKSSFQLRKYVQESRSFKVWNSVVILSWTKCRPESMDSGRKFMLFELSYKVLSELKPFQNEQELIIFCQICELSGEPDKLNELVGEIFKYWGAEKKEFLDLYLKDLLIRNLRRLNRFEELHDSCKCLLKHFDDYQVLKELIYSSWKLDKPAEDVKSLFSDTRNGRVAYFELCSVYEGNISPYSLRHYLSKYHDKPCCPVDLTYYSEKIDTTVLLNIFDEYSSSLQHDTNRIKIADPVSIEEYNRLFLKYQPTLKLKPTTDYSSCSFLILHIVQELVQHSKISLSNVVTSIAILEKYQAEDPFNYETRVWLIILYQYLGISPLAYKHYRELSIKNVQNDNIDHLLYTRCSTFYPNKNHDYLRKFMPNGQEDAIYRSLNDLPSIIKISFEKNSYSKIPEMISFYDQLQRSCVRWMKIVEYLKFLRLFNDKRSFYLKNVHEKLLKLGFRNFGNWADNRDYNLLGGKSGYENFKVVIGYMTVDNNYVTLQVCQELMIESITTGTSNENVDKVLASSNVVTESMSPSELWAWNIVTEFYIHMDKVSIAKLMELINKIPDLGKERNWELVHGYTSQVMMLKTLDSLKRCKDQDLKNLINAKLTFLRAKSMQYFQDYISDVKASIIDNSLFGSLSNSSALKTIVDGLIDVSKVVHNI